MKISFVGRSNEKFFCTKKIYDILQYDIVACQRYKSFKLQVGSLQRQVAFFLFRP